MDLVKLLEKIDAIESREQLTEAKKTPTTWTDKSGKEHPATRVSGGKYSGEEAEKEEKSKEDKEDKKSKKKVKESSMEDLLRALDAIMEAEQVEEEKIDEEDVEEGNEFSGALAKAKAAGKKEFEVDGKTYPVKEGAVEEAKDRQPAKEKETSWKDKSGKEHPAKQVQGWQSRRADKEAEDETEKTMKESAQLDECGVMAGDSGMSDSGMSVNTNIDTRTGRKSVSVTADGDAADQLMQMLKLAGISGDAHESHEAGHETAVVSVPLAQADGGFDMRVKEELANAPDEKYASVDAVTASGTDMHKSKNAYRMAQPGDNPMAVREAKELARLEKEIMEGLAEIKVVKKD